jgi:hypothetical protein
MAHLWTFSQLEPYFVTRQVDNAVMTTTRKTSSHPADFYHIFKDTIS